MLRKGLAGYNQAARFSPWVVLLDLDRDYECAPALIRSWLPVPAPLLSLRVAVREIEAWLMADRQAMAEFLRVPESNVPVNPDSLPDPKRVLIDLGRRSTDSGIRRDIVPRLESGWIEGRGYTSRMAVYAGSGQWRPRVAARHSDSLKRCLAAMRRLVR